MAENDSLTTRRTRRSVQTPPTIEGRVKDSYYFRNRTRAGIVFRKDRWLPIPPGLAEEVRADTLIETRPIEARE